MINGCPKGSFLSQKRKMAPTFFAFHLETVCLHRQQFLNKKVTFAGTIKSLRRKINPSQQAGKSHKNHQLNFKQALKPVMFLLSWQFVFKVFE